jgi:hypothetical protein
MFVGHYGVSFAGKSARPRVPLWVWFIAVQWMDVVWSVLVFLGIEKLHIVPGFLYVALPQWPQGSSGLR